MEAAGNGDGMRTKASAKGPEALRKCISSYEDEGSIESHRYYLARRTLLEMLCHRGFIIHASDLLSQSLEDFRATYGQRVDTDRIRISTNHRNDTSKHVNWDFLYTFSFPKMLKADAIARYYGLTKGQVVKLTRSGEITGSHISYRCVW